MEQKRGWVQVVWEEDGVRKVRGEGGVAGDLYVSEDRMGIGIGR